MTRFTVWNEPNRGQFFQPQGAHGFEAPRLMAGLMRSCAGAIHAVSPDAQVALGPLASRGGLGGIAPLAFLKRYRARRRSAARRRGAQPVSREPAARLPRRRRREPDGAITIRNLDRLEDALTAAYGDTVPIWLTEFAWRTAEPGSAASRRSGRPSWPSSRSTLVREHYPYAEMLVWFLLRDVSPTSYWRSGLVDSANDKKPVFATWARLARVSEGETLPSRVMLALWIVIAVVVLILLYLVYGYNKLVRLRNEAEQGFSGIDVQLKRRADLIPNLVETVKAYATHEREVFERVAEARAQSLAARGVGAAAAAAGVMTAGPDRACSASPRPIPSCARPRTSSACRPS